MEEQKSTVPNYNLAPSTSGSVIELQKGKLPPQAVEFEEVVLGAMMIDKKGLDEIIDILSPDVFYKISHQEIFKAIFHLFETNEPIDLLTVSNELRKQKKLEAVGGEYYLVQLTNKVTSSAHIEYHSRILLQKFILRKLIEVSNNIIHDAYDDSTDVFSLLDKAENKLFEITNGNLKKSTERADSLVRQAIQKIEDISKQEGLSGVPTGFTKLDQLTSGWQNSDLIIIAARPGMGKTAFVLSMAKNIAVDFKLPIVVFSLEMSSVQLITRLISSETALGSEKLRKGNLTDYEWTQLRTKIRDLEDAPLFIDDTPALSIFELRARCRRLVSQQGVKLIVIDYLQLMTLGVSQKAGNREQEISTISRNLKAIAKELNVPVIALSQLSRTVETRAGSKRPILSDLRESGAIEQDADIVSFIYRPEYYGMTEWDDDQASPCEGQGEFIVAKHRNGGLDEIRLKFVGALAKFTDLEDDSTGVYESKMNELNDFRMDSNDVFGDDDDDEMDANDFLSGSTPNVDPDNPPF